MILSLAVIFCSDLPAAECVSITFMFFGIRLSSKIANKRSCFCERSACRKLVSKDKKDDTRAGFWKWRPMRQKNLSCAREKNTHGAELGVPADPCTRAARLLIRFKIGNGVNWKQGFYERYLSSSSLAEDTGGRTSVYRSGRFFFQHAVVHNVQSGSIKYAAQDKSRKTFGG